MSLRRDRIRLHPAALAVLLLLIAAPASVAGDYLSRRIPGGPLGTALDPGSEGRGWFRVALGTRPETCFVNLGWPQARTQLHGPVPPRLRPQASGRGS